MPSVDVAPRRRGRAGGGGQMGEDAASPPRPWPDGGDRPGCPARAILRTRGDAGDTGQRAGAAPGLVAGRPRPHTANGWTNRGARAHTRWRRRNRGARKTVLRAEGRLRVLPPGDI